MFLFYWFLFLKKKKKKNNNNEKINPLGKEVQLAKVYSDTAVLSTSMDLERSTQGQEIQNDGIVSTDGLIDTDKLLMNTGDEQVLEELYVTGISTPQRKENERNNNNNEELPPVPIIQKVENPEIDEGNNDDIYVPKSYQKLLEHL